MMTALPPVASMVEMAVTSEITGAVRLTADKAFGSYEVRYKQAVHHGIKGHEHGHNDGRDGKHQHVFQGNGLSICIFTGHK